MAAPLEERWLVDEMLGRLARFLRILGYDSEYAQGMPDDAIRDRALGEGRTLITRDAELAERTAGAVLLTSTDLKGQLIALRGKYPQLARAPRFIRCTLCNGTLRVFDQGEAGTSEVPSYLLERASKGELYRCERCAHLFWEGSHTGRIREFLKETAVPVPG